MCGLLGASGKIDPARIRALGCLNASRGTDSAGIGWFAEEPHLAKATGHPAAVFSLELEKDLLIASATGQVIGHTRAATTGSVTADNAHPFLMDGILFAHNGIITNHAQFGSYAVDSQSLIHGIKKMDFSEYQGPVALLWLIGNKLFAYRKGNPLHRGILDGGLYLSSEDDALKEIGCTKIKEIKEGIAYMISGGKIEDVVRVKPNKTHTMVTYYGSSSRGTYQQNWWQESVYDNDPRTIKTNDTDECYCGHPASDHNRENFDRNGWGCYARSATNGGCCLCNRYMYQAPTPGALTPSVCLCKHSTVSHQWQQGTSPATRKKVCQIPKCPCLDFEEDIEPEKYEPDEPCDCGHEYEYHDTKEQFAPCGVSESGILCGCTVFFPFREEDAFGKRPWHWHNSVY